MNSGDKTDTENTTGRDEEAEAELEGVPESLREETAGDDPVLEEHDRIAGLEEQLAEARQQVLYAKAEEQNTRRRLEQERQKAADYAATAFAREILSVSDNLDRALAAIPGELREDEKLKGLVAGIEATGKELEKVFRNHGIEEIEAMGEALDPNRHQAMVEIPHDEAEPGTVIEVMQRGYMIKDRLLRPALVGLAKKAEG
ncbi:MAG: nucleotide exchange factor GrpE [Parasphingopyxis sp.]|nr:nucleotide exchange factor GrpE [Sphingomonadales bacterium]